MREGCKECQRKGRGCFYHPDEDRKELYESKQCGAKNRSNGKKCKLAAGWGTDHPGFGYCRRHMGNTPNGKKHAQKRQVDYLMRTYGVPMAINPHEAIASLIDMTWGHVVWLADQLSRRQNMGDPMTMYMLDLYDRERRLLAAVSRDAVAAGIMERHVAVAEEHTKLFATALRGILDELGVSDDPKTIEVVRRHLTLVKSEAA